MGKKKVKKKVQDKAARRGRGKAPSRKKSKRTSTRAMRFKSRSVTRDFEFSLRPLGPVAPIVGEVLQLMENQTLEVYRPDDEEAFVLNLLTAVQNCGAGRPNSAALGR